MLAKPTLLQSARARQVRLASAQQRVQPHTASSFHTVAYKELPLTQIVKRCTQRTSPAWQRAASPSQPITTFPCFVCTQHAGWHNSMMERDTAEPPSDRGASVSDDGAGLAGEDSTSHAAVVAEEGAEAHERMRAEFSCKRCRTLLFTGDDLEAHQTGKHSISVQKLKVRHGALRARQGTAHMLIVRTWRRRRRGTQHTSKGRAPHTLLARL